MKHLKEEILEKRLKDLDDRLNNVEKNNKNIKLNI
jgi:hypothetical protein